MEFRFSRDNRIAALIVVGACAVLAAPGSPRAFLVGAAPLPQVPRSCDKNGENSLLDQIQKRNLQTGDVPNRTKATRLIVVHGGKTVEQLATENNATRADAFIVKEQGRWQVKSWTGKKQSSGALELVNHDDAVKTDREATVVLIVADREQIQWESNVPFRITSITPGRINPQLCFLQNNNPPRNPFAPGVVGAKGGPDHPIRSGPPLLHKGTNGAYEEYHQLYKVSFALTIPGEPREVPIDPDVYCDFR